jgi:hypothetical protein
MPLPKREKHGPAELDVLDAWIEKHGDPAGWPEETRLAYANTIANMRAGGAL